MRRRPAVRAAEWTRVTGDARAERPSGGEPIRVAMLINGYYPVVGGAERQLAAVAPALVARGLRVDVLTRRFPGLAPQENIEGVSVHRLPATGPKAVKSLTFTVAALRLLRRLRPDVLHAHDLYSPSTTALVAKRIFGTPVVVKVPRGGHLGDLARLRGRFLGHRRIAWLRRGVDRFVVISREIDAELDAAGVPPERRISIPNAVDTGRFAPLAPDRKAALRRALDLPEGPIVVYTGRLAPEKRLHDLVGIWPAVRAGCPGAQLVLVGSGDQAASLARAAGEGVSLPGPVLDVAPYLQAADLFVLPSSAEGLSNALLEAMSAGLACVATAVGAGPELIDPGENGWLIPAGEPEALRRAVLAALNEPQRRAAVGLRARERVASRYSLPVVAARFPELYRQVIVAAPGRTCGSSTS